MTRADGPETSAHIGVVRRLLKGARRRSAAVRRGASRVLDGFEESSHDWLSRGSEQPGLRGWLERPATQLAGLAALGYLPIAVSDATRLGLPFALAILLGVICVVPIVLLAWRPWIAWAVAVSVTWLLGVVVPVDPGPPWPWLVTYGLVTLLTLVVVAITSRLVVTVLATAVTATLFGSMSAVNTQVGWAVGVALFAAGGVLIRWRRLVRRQLVEHEELTDVEKARRTVLEERARIARDLHDVVAHRMSLVVVAAETAPYRIPGVSNEMRAELETISSTAREALTELRGLLGVLRSSDDQPVYAPQPVLEDIGTLVDGAVRAGLQVELSIVGQRRSLRSAVELGGYRIVQESLANAARHAPGAQVCVIVAFEPSALRVEVVNEPPRVAPPPVVNGAAGASPVGHGLSGMSERAAVVGGWVHAAATQDGGFRVTAVLPTDQGPTR